MVKHVYYCEGVGGQRFDFPHSQFFSPFSGIFPTMWPLHWQSNLPSGFNIYLPTPALILYRCTVSLLQVAILPEKKQITEEREYEYNQTLVIARCRDALQGELDTQQVWIDRLAGICARHCAMVVGGTNPRPFYSFCCSAIIIVFFRLLSLFRFLNNTHLSTC